MQLRKFVLALYFLIGCMPLLKAQTMSTEQYIATYRDIAIEEMHRSGVPAAIKLAQGILETQSGNGWLVLNSNNHFGIKCKNNWTGASVSYDDDARNECFRKYNSAAESYRDHSNFLKNNPRYSFLFQFEAKDYKSWAYGLKQAGYATSRTYPQQLIKIIEDYHLQDYTLEGLGLAKAPRGREADNDAAPPEDTRDYQPGRAAVTAAATAQAPAPAAAAPAPRPASYPKGVFEINGRKVLYLPAGTALIQVANERDIHLRKLVSYNDLPDDRPLPRDMFVFLQKKSKRGKDDYHVVAAGETMYDIAQAEGIQLRWLRRRNRMQEGQEPAPGEKLALDGYASKTPRLRVKSIMRPEDEQQHDLQPGKMVREIKEEIVKAQEQAQAQAAVQAQQQQQQQGGLPAGMVEDLKKVAEVTPVNNAGQSAGPAQTPAAPTPVAQAPAPQPAPATRNTQRPVLQYHDVQPKETLYGIAKRYNVSVEQLQQWNNIQAFDIKIGQRLLVGKL